MGAFFMRFENLKYPRNWAAKVFEEFVIKYPRGCNFLERFLHIYAHEMIGLLMVNAKEWHTLVNIAKKAQKRMEESENDTTVLSQVVQQYYTNVQVKPELYDGTTDWVWGEALTRLFENL